jgi:hypothetical protein
MSATKVIRSREIKMAGHEHIIEKEEKYIQGCGGET